MTTLDDKTTIRAATVNVVHGGIVVSLILDADKGSAAVQLGNGQHCRTTGNDLVAVAVDALADLTAEAVRFLADEAAFLEEHNL